MDGLRRCLVSYAGTKDAQQAGILLLIAKNEGLARIALGPAWGRTKDIECRRIVDEEMLARFKKGEFSAGILAGVEALEKMVRGEKLLVAGP